MSINRLKKIVLTRKQHCEHCQEAITVTAYEALKFDSVECPYCLSDVYYSKSVVDEAIGLEENA